MRFFLPGLSALLAVVLATPVHAGVRSLGIVGPANEQTIAYDINAAGQVAAVLENDAGRQRGVLFDKGKLTEIGSLGGDFSDARAINSGGVIAGSAQAADGHWRAFLYERAMGMRELGTLGGPSSYGLAIDDAANVAGFADTESGDFHAFHYTRGGAMKDLGTLGGKISYASGMNNVGQVVGTAATATEFRHAFLYDPVRGMVDLGTLGGRQSSATAVNDKGVVVGASETKDRRWHAFVHDGRKMVDLGALIGFGSSFATDINSAGHVVGTVLRGEERLSFVWRDNTMTVHRGGHGLHLTHTITDKEIVVGATYSKRLDAATMSAAAPAVVARGGSELLALVAAMLVAALAGVAYSLRFGYLSRRSYRA